MLRISKLTDYGVVLSTHLAGLDSPASVRDLAAETQIPSATVSKVLKALARAGVVSSQRGPGGGYLLARSAQETSVVEIITALEGPIAVTECSDATTDSSCEYEDGCGTRANWQRINVAVQQALEGISLAEMAATSAPRLVPLARSGEEAARLRAREAASAAASEGA